jgi:hypothetical protein
MFKILPYADIDKIMINLFLNLHASSLNEKFSYVPTSYAAILQSVENDDFFPAIKSCFTYCRTNFTYIAIGKL